jgi:hypothetical protein
MDDCFYGRYPAYLMSSIVWYIAFSKGGSAGIEVTKEVRRNLFEQFNVL